MKIYEHQKKKDKTWIISQSKKSLKTHKSLKTLYALNPKSNANCIFCLADFFDSAISVQKI